LSNPILTVRHPRRDISAKHDLAPEININNIDAVRAHKTGTLANLQMLRAIAATLIVFVHLDVLLGMFRVPAFGYGGVDLFFVISGFIMVYTTHRRKITAADFLENRFARVAPIYYAATLAVYGVALFAPAILQATTTDPLQLLKSLLFIPFVKRNGLVEPVLFVGWTLNYEMFFYVIFSLGMLFRTRAVGLCCTIGAMAVLTVAGLIVPSTNVLFRFYTSPIILEFALGMLIAVAFCQGMLFKESFWTPILILALIISIAGLVVIPLFPYTSLSRAMTCGPAAALAVAAAVGLESRGVFVKWAAIIRTGDASYSLYLVHPFITQAFQKLFAVTRGGAALAALLILFCLITTLLAAQCVHFMIERPLTRWARGILGAVRLKPSHPNL
jgi:exopolysaccharide production protein ExoZ